MASRRTRCGRWSHTSSATRSTTTSGGGSPLGCIHLCRELGYLLAERAQALDDDALLLGEIARQHPGHRRALDAWKRRGPTEPVPQRSEALVGQRVVGPLTG